MAARQLPNWLTVCKTVGEGAKGRLHAYNSAGIVASLALQRSRSIVEVYLRFCQLAAETT